MRALFTFILIITATGMACDMPSTCDQLVPEIIALSEEYQNAFNPRILKMYNVQSVDTTDYALECVADAKLSHGPDQSIKFYLEIDADGDGFISYEGESFLDEQLAEMDKELQKNREELDKQLAEINKDLQETIGGSFKSQTPVNTSSLKASTPVPVTVDEIIGDYSNHVVRANAKYNSMIYSLRFKVADIESHPRGGALVLRSGYSQMKAYISVEEILNINVGDTVLLACSNADASGDFMGVFVDLNGCDVLEVDSQ